MAQYVRLEDGSISWPLFRDPWPAFDVVRLPAMILRPFRLYGTSPKSFSLMTAGSTITPLLRLMQAYGKMITFLPDCVAALHLWATSLGQPAFNPISLPLMVINGAQVIVYSFISDMLAQTKSTCSAQVGPIVSRSQSPRSSNGGFVTHIPLRNRTVP